MITEDGDTDASSQNIQPGFDGRISVYELQLAIPDELVYRDCNDVSKERKWSMENDWKSDRHTVGRQHSLRGDACPIF